MDKSYAQNQAQSPLLRLPTEVRLMIYKYVLGGDRVICIYEPSLSHESKTAGGFACSVVDREWWPKREIYPKRIQDGFTLLSPVCQQLYDETSKMPFQWNLFGFTHSTIQRFIMKEKRLPYFQRREIRELWIEARRPSKRLISRFSSLEKVTVDHLSGVATEYKVETSGDLTELRRFRLS